MRVPDRLIADVADRLSIVEVVGEYVPLQKRGGRYWGLCPFHQEKTPSFAVNPDKQVYYCFGCHKGGGLYNFVMEMEKLGFVEAVRLLAEKAGVEFVQEGGEEDGREVKEREAYLELYRRVAGSLHHILLRHNRAAEARRYLVSRGVGQDALKQFQVGYAPADRDWLLAFLKEKNYSPPFLAKSGLFTQRRGDELFPLFRDRILFPILNHRGEVVAFGGRSLKDGTGPKYLNTPETAYFHKRAHLFGPPGVFRKVREQNSFVLVEGYMDVLALHQAGVENCLAPLGTALTPEQLKLLKRFAPSGLLLFDGDEAGFTATRKAAELSERMGLTVDVVPLEEGRDPAEIIEKQGPGALQKVLKCPINSFQFLLDKARVKYDFKTPEGKEGIVKFLHSYLAAVESQVRRDGYLRILAESLEVEFESVRADFVLGMQGFRHSGGGSSAQAARGAPGAPAEARRLFKPTELFTFLAVACNLKYFAELRKTIALDDLEDEQARRLYIALEECFRNEESSLEALLARIEDEQLRQLVLEKNAAGEFTINQERVIGDGIISLRQRSLEKKRDSIQSLLDRNNKQELWKLKELQAEKIFLDEELQNLRVLPNDRFAD
jgi:DNA primase